MTSILFDRAVVWHPLRVLHPTGLALALLVSLGLPGCASAPGMSMAETSSNTSAATTTAAADAPAGAGQAAPSGQLQPITWELIAQQRAQAPDLRLAVAPLIHKDKAAAAYRIGAGDVLSIAVWEHPELSMATMTAGTTDASASVGYLVSAAGDIQFPFLGKFRVSGMTESEAYTALTRALGKILRNPQLTVRIQNYRSQRVYVDGDVRTPGVYNINDIPMTLPEAINRAGGALPTADTSRVLLQRDAQRYTLNIPALAAQGVNPGDVLLQPGDMLRLPNRDESKVYVIGEVQKPAALPMQFGRLTLNAALGEAAGVNPLTGNARQVYVIRTQNEKMASAENPPAVFHLDAKSPVALILAEQFDLQPKDVVYVDSAPLATWNRVISLLLPSMGFASTLKTVSGN